jgi:hypothetical protein
MPLSFRLGDSSRSVYPVVSLEWSGVSLTEYSLRMVSPIFTLVLVPIGYPGRCAFVLILSLGDAYCHR